MRIETPLCNRSDEERAQTGRRIGPRREPERATIEQFRQMQQNLLKERFKLAVHFEKKELPGYELVAAKGGLKMQQAEPPKTNSEDPPRPGPVISSSNLTKDGLPIIPRGARGMIMMNGKASWGAEATVEEIAAM